MISMLEEFKTNGNKVKMGILYLLLIISNIVLLIGLFNHFSSVGIHIELESFEYFSSVIPTIIILGIITSKFAKLQEQDSALYDTWYLIIITLLGLMSSYFSAKSNTDMLFSPYLEIFRILCVVLIFALVALLLEPMKEIIHGKYTKKNLFICLIIFTALGIYATVINLDVDGAPANVRCMVVMISGLFGGPFVGIPVGLISGAFRYSAGGVSALPCAVSTALSGIIGSLVFMWNDKKFPKPTVAVTLMFLFTGFEMLLFILMTPPDISFSYVHNIYPEMLFASVIGMTLFAVIVRDKRKTDSTDSSEIEKELEGNKEIQELKNEIKKLKSEIGELKK